MNGRHLFILVCLVVGVLYVAEGWQRLQPLSKHCIQRNQSLRRLGRGSEPQALRGLCGTHGRRGGPGAGISRRSVPARRSAVQISASRRGVGEGDSETAVVAPIGQGKPVAPPKTQGDVEPSSGTPPTATKASGGAGAQSEHESGETTPATGGASQVGLHIGLGAASVGLSLLAGYLKARVDAKIAQKQIDALLHVAGQRINAHPDEALKKMMFAPEVTTYAWVFLNSSVITFFEANTGPEPTTSDSAPMIDIDSIDYAYQPVDPSIPQNFLSGISGGGRHLTTMRTLIIDIPLVTPSVEDMFEYAKAHNIWLGGLRDYVMYRLQKSLANFQIAVSDLELHQGTQKDIDKAELQNRYWQDLADRILAAEKKQTASAR